MSSLPSTTSNPERDCSQLAIVALGANLPSTAGTPAETIRAVLEELRQLGSVQASSPLSSKPENCPPGSPDFVNAVALIAVSSDLHPRQLLEYLQSLEQRYGRVRSEQQPANAPRPLDLDLISLGSWILKDPELTLPHPRAELRRFVLEPLHELLPNYVLPGTDVPVHELLLRLDR